MPRPGEVALAPEGRGLDARQLPVLWGRPVSRSAGLSPFSRLPGGVSVRVVILPAVLGPRWVPARPREPRLPLLVASPAQCKCRGGFPFIQKITDDLLGQSSEIPSLYWNT